MDVAQNNEVQLSKEIAQSNFASAINHMFGLGTQGHVRSLLLANYIALNYCNQIFSTSVDFIESFQKQVLDDYTTCLQGQTNRLLIALNYTVGAILEYQQNPISYLIKNMLLSLQNNDLKQRHLTKEC